MKTTKLPQVFLTALMFTVLYNGMQQQVVADALQSGKASFYGGGDGSGTTGEACGYGNLYSHSYGTSTAAVSAPLFNNGLSCGGCYQIWCADMTGWCKPNTSIVVTVTNYCAPSVTLPNKNDRCCTPPLKHFQLPVPSFEQIAQYEAGSVPVKFKKVPCARKGGIKFTIDGRPGLIRVMIDNVGGAGEIHEAWIKGSKTGWEHLSRNWGQNWQSNSNLVGQSLSFKVTTSDGKTVISNNIAPAEWQFGQTFEGGQFGQR